MDTTFLEHVREQLAEIEAQGLTKRERIVSTPQGAWVQADGRHVVNLCANNYLGLADHPEVLAAAADGLRTHGFGMASVRFICGTQDLHTELEARISAFLGTEATQLYGSCFDANGGVFEPLLGEQDAVISDALNHASIIDGIRLCKARRLRYANNDMADLERQLVEARAGGARFVLVVTDGVFSMDGSMADLPAICDLAQAHGAMVMVDDSHAVGFVGAHGRGTPEHLGVMGRVDILTGTMGKALGGASGGYVSSRQEVVDLLRQRSRPYLFSNSVAPPVVAASLRVLELLQGGDDLRTRLWANAAHFRAGMAALGFDLLPGEHPIIPVMLGDARRAVDLASGLLEEGVYVTAFSFPVVPRGQARIRTQMSAAHSTEDLDLAMDAFARVGRQLGVIA
ncbi:MAG: glycine C-acetyltransferase [Candidatus Nanopelagicales bacterium]|nr:glycine C-acetyltransferase [Candidatus Nanopelagicales bacterium]